MREAITKTLHISDDLELPLNAVTQKLAWLGRTGSGKTYGASKLAEEMLGAGAQVVILDAVGVWYGLRLAADGRGKGIEIPVFGGLHGDVPLEPTGGALLANLIVDRGISVVLDVSQLESDAAKARFAHEWGDRFFFRKKASPSAVHIFLEECQEFVPQEPMKGEERMLHAFQRISKLGRNFGIGVSLISQRPQEVNKKALNQTECLFAFQMTGPQERKAIKAWVDEKGLDDDIVDVLPRLKVGQPHVWSPQWLEISKTIHIARKQTFNASSTPTVTGGKAVTRHLAPIDLAQVRHDMAATIEKFKAEDPKELRKTIAELHGQLAYAAKAKPAAAPPPPKAPRVVEKPILSEATVKRLEATAKKIETALDGAGRHFAALAHAHAGVADQIRAAIAAAKALQQGVRHEDVGTRVGAGRPGAVVGTPAPAGAIRPAPSIQRRPDIRTDVELTAYARGLLETIARRHPMRLRRLQVATLAGRKPRSSAFDLSMGKLVKAGLIEADRDGLYVLTDGGIAAAGAAIGSAAETPAQLREKWKTALPRYERCLFEVLLAAYPAALSRAELGRRTGKSTTSSAFDLAISNLKKNQLATVDRDGLLVASENLFLDGAA